MPVVPCPKCRAELDLDAADIGHMVECPACRVRFTASSTAPLPPKTTLEPETAVVPCPECDRSVSILAADRGHIVQCPHCELAFEAPRAKSERRRSRRRSRTWNDEDDLPEDIQWRARHRLQTPGSWIQALGWVDVAVGFLGLIMGIALLVGTLNGPPAPGPSWEFAALTIGQGVSSIVVGGLKGIGGAAMKQVKNRPLSVVTAVATCVPLNVNCCLWIIQVPLYFVGLAFGIMALTVLFRADVKRAFEMNRPGGDLDAV